MWSRRGLLAGGLAAALAGCGFAPVYATGPGAGGGGLALRGAVRAAEPRDDRAFAFVRQLEERLGRAPTPRYDLTYAIAMSEVDLAIDGSDRITRLSVEGRVDWSLVPASGGAAVLSGTETAFAGYSAPASTVATLASRRDAERRLAIILADRVVTRLLAAAPELAAAAP